MTSTTASTRQGFQARFVASWPVTQLSTQLRTLVMATFPRTHLQTWYARLSTLFRLAFTVYATVFAISGTRWAWHNAGFPTYMRTNQDAATP